MACASSACGRIGAWSAAVPNRHAWPGGRPGSGRIWQLAPPTPIELPQSTERVPHHPPRVFTTRGLWHERKGTKPAVPCPSRAGPRFSARHGVRVWACRPLRPVSFGQRAGRNSIFKSIQKMKSNKLVFRLPKTIRRKKTPLQLFKNFNSQNKFSYF